jgi:hypothetical protein
LKRNPVAGILRAVGRLLVSAILVVAAAAPAGAAELKLFDAHIHYSMPDWSAYPVDAVLAILDRAGVERALVSSTPDDGTIRLYERDPRRIVPELRPYRSRADMATWHRDPAVLAYVEERLTRGIYKGIGEFHLRSEDAGSPVMKRIVELAVRRGLVLHSHSDAAAIQGLFAHDPRVKVLWAHAGMSAGPAEVAAMLDRYPSLSVELALRTDVAPGGTLDPEWRALFLRYPDRFSIGTDTWITSRWEELPDYLAGVRAWLRQLPPDVAERIAFTNAARLYGAQ